MKRICILFCCVLLLSFPCMIGGQAMDVATTFNLDSLEAYHAYWEEHGTPENFVTYEQLSFLGEFRWSVHPIEGMIGRNHHGYVLTVTHDESSSSIIGISVYHDLTSLSYLNEKQALTPSGHDLREDRGTGLYRHDENLGYDFYNGKLQTVYLKIDDMVLGIESTSTRWDDFDPNEEFVVSRLLNQETASMAYLEFVSLFRGEPLPPFLTSPFGNGSDGADNSTKDEGCSSVASGGLGILILCAAAPMLKKKKR